MDEKHAELIHRSIDGEITNQERVELERLIIESESVRAFYEKMLLLKSLAEERQDVSPPPDLKPNVLAQVRRAHGASVRKTSAWQEIGLAIRAIVTPRMAYGVAAGILIGFAVGAMVMKAGGDTIGSRNSIEFSGSLGLPSSTGGLRHVDSDFQAADGLAVHLIADRSDDHILVRVNIESDSKADLTLTYESELLEIQGLENDQSDIGDAVVSDGKLRLSQSGTSTFLILFRVIGSGPDNILCQATAKNVEYSHQITLGNRSN